eukprot:GCRY01002193.1.p1 GENE.GCRY01002193.1~~GCRY01002193.1.p1  ORF type:complete len:126 (+),score=6.44 GCRY01002193.1:760-1137(+)
MWEEVVLATCCDDNHPPSNVLDNDSTTFWMTTGMYPQLLRLKFTEPRSIKRLKLVSFQVKEIAVRVATEVDGEFVPVLSKTLSYRPGRIQEDVFPDLTESPVRCMELEIVEGHDDFSALYTVACL